MVIIEFVIGGQPVAGFKVDRAKANMGGVEEYNAGVVFEKDKIILSYTTWEQVGNAE